MYNMYEDQKIAKKQPKHHQKGTKNYWFCCKITQILSQNLPTFFHENFGNFSQKNWLCDMVTIYAQHGTNFYGRNQMVPGL